MLWKTTSATLHTNWHSYYLVGTHVNVSRGYNLWYWVACHCDTSGLVVVWASKGIIPLAPTLLMWEYLMEIDGCVKESNMEAFCLAVAGCSTKQLRQAFPPYLQMGTLQLLNCTWRNASLVWDNMRSLRSAVTQSSTGSGTHLDLQIVKPQAHTMRGVLNRVILRSLRAPSKPRAIKTFLICVMHLLYPSL